MSNFVFYFHDELDSEVFEQKLLWFKSRYNIISYQDLIQYLYNGKKLKNSCLLTVDDGWRSTYEVIFPLIKKHNLPLTIFVSPEVCVREYNFWYDEIKIFDEHEFLSFLVRKGFFSERIDNYPLEMVLKELSIKDIYEVIELFKKENNIEGKSRGFINIKELLEMSQSGLVEIGAHTMTHPILANETEEVSRSEIVSSIEMLSELINKPITAFAYPNGLYGVDFGQREINTIKSSGIKAAFSVNPGYINSKTPPLCIPRIGSLSRLKIPFGVYLPSRMRQEKIRSEIRACKL